MEKTGRACLRKRKLRGWHIAPTFRQTLEGWRKYGEIFPKGYCVRFKSPLRAYFPSTGSEVEFRSTHNSAYEHWRAAGLDFADWDESGTIPHDAFLTLQPMLTDNPHSTQTCIGSPRGRNWFHEKCMLGRDKNSGWWSPPFAWPSILRPSFSRSEWERMKRELPDMWFRQEFLAEFLTNTQGAFRQDVGSDFEYIEFDQLNSYARRHELHIGVDFARKVDFTEIVVTDERGRVIYHERYQLTGWPEIVERCFLVQQACRGAPMAIDATGLGDVVLAMLLERGCEDVYPYIYTNDTKAGLFITGQKLNERGKIKVPRSDSYSCHEFEACEVDVNKNGKYIFGAPQGEHDDFVNAVLLALWLAHRNDRFDLGIFKHYEPEIAVA